MVMIVILKAILLMMMMMTSLLVVMKYLVVVVISPDLAVVLTFIIYEDECYNPLTYIHEGLTFLYTNADNLINKMDELRARVVVTNPDIIIITEVYPQTCDSTEILPVELDITGYICFRSNVMKSSRGVVIYVKDIISAERRNNLSDSNFLESVWVDVNINKQDKILIGGTGFYTKLIVWGSLGLKFEYDGGPIIEIGGPIFLYKLPEDRKNSLSSDFSLIEIKNTRKNSH